VQIGGTQDSLTHSAQQSSDSTSVVMHGSQRFPEGTWLQISEQRQLKANVRRFVSFKRQQLHVFFVTFLTA